MRPKDPPPGGDDEDGPWHDSAGLASFEDAGAQLDLAYTNEAQRQAEDALPLPRKSEDRTEWLLSRASRGTYVPPAYFRQPEPSHGCGPLDEYSRCSSRFHSAECFETVRGSAASGTTEAAEAWRQALLSSPSSADVTLARRTGMDWEDVLDSGPADTGTLSRARALLGITGKTGLPPFPAPSTAAQQLGVF